MRRWEFVNQSRRFKSLRFRCRSLFRFGRRFLRRFMHENPLSMEDLDQAYGYLLYRTQLNGPVSGELVIEDLHDYAQVYLDGKLVGTLDRREGQNHLKIDVTAPHARLDILVENSGRVNFTKVIRGERQGITKQVTLAGKVLQGWDMYPLPMENTGTSEVRSRRMAVPGLASTARALMSIRPPILFSTPAFLQEG